MCMLCLCIYDYLIFGIYGFVLFVIIFLLILICVVIIVIVIVFFLPLVSLFPSKSVIVKKIIIHM